MCSSNENSLMSYHRKKLDNKLEVKANFDIVVADGMQLKIFQRL